LVLSLSLSLVGSAALTGCSKSKTEATADDDELPKRKAKKSAADEGDDDAPSKKKRKKSSDDDGDESPKKKADSDEGSSADDFYHVPADAVMSAADRKRVERVANARMGKLMKDPRIQKIITREVKGADPDTAFARGAAIGERMGRRGVARLPFEKLKVWSDVRLKLAGISPDVCAGLWTGNSTAAQLNEGFAKLDNDDLDAFFKVLADGMRLELDADGGDLPKTSATALGEGLNELVDLVPKADAAKYARALKTGTLATRDEACAATRAVHGHWRDLKKTDGEDFLRALAVAVAGGT
jgi:hypothetical protein